MKKLVTITVQEVMNSIIVDIKYELKATDVTGKVVMKETKPFGKVNNQLKWGNAFAEKAIKNGYSVYDIRILDIKYID